MQALLRFMKTQTSRTEVLAIIETLEGMLRSGFRVDLLERRTYWLGVLACM